MAGGGGVVAGAGVGQEAEAVEAVDGEDGQPEVEGEAGEHREEHTLLPIRLLEITILTLRLELEMNLREDFTITENAPSRA